MDVFVTGGTGYIGRHVTATLLDRGHNVIGLARTDQSADLLRNLGATVLEGRLQQSHVLRRGVTTTDATVHLASAADPHEAAEVDEKAVRVMLDAASGEVPFVYPSDVVVYGYTESPAEESRLPDTDVHHWLVRQERRVVRAHERSVRPFVFRLGLVYGDRGGFIRTLVNVAHDIGAVPVLDVEHADWCTVNVADLGDLFARAITASADDAGVYNIAADNVTMEAVAQRIGDALDYPVVRASVDDFAELLPMEREAAEILASDLAKRIRVNTTKVQEFGWEPTHESLLAYAADIEA